MLVSPPLFIANALGVTLLAEGTRDCPRRMIYYLMPTSEMLRAFIKEDKHIYDCDLVTTDMYETNYIYHENVSSSGQRVRKLLDSDARNMTASGPQFFGRIYPKKNILGHFQW